LGVGKQQDVVHPSWHVLDLDDPAVEPRALPPASRTPNTAGTMRPFATGGSGIYILCWTVTSYHLIGPFADDGQCTELLNWDDVYPYFDPCGNYGWAVLRLNVPPSPQVMPPTMAPLPEDEVQQRRMNGARAGKWLF
jgi:hypothetical protein